MSGLFRSWFCGAALIIAVGFATTVSAQSADSDCFIANGTPGCDNAYCETANCAVDSYCCETEWDNICVNGNGDELLGSISVCPGDCLATGHGAGCSNPVCETTVCAIDSACCDTNWTNTCVNLAHANCGFPTFELEGTEFCFPIVAKNGNVAVTCLGPDVLKPLDANPPGNKKPNVFAGPDQTITLPPTNTVSLNANVNDDGLPTPPMLTYLWEQTGGTTTGVNIVSPTTEDTDVSFTAADVYTFKLTADDGELSGSDQVQVTVNNPPPDLIVNNVSVTNATPNTGEAFRIDATVKNQGTGPSAITTLNYYLSPDNAITGAGNDSAIDTDSVPSLGAGVSSQQDRPNYSISTAGTYFIGACVDAVSGESQTNNQCFTPGVQVDVGLCGGQVLQAGWICLECNGQEVIFGDGLPDPAIRTLANCNVHPQPPHFEALTCNQAGCHQ